MLTEKEVIEIVQADAGKLRQEQTINNTIICAIWAMRRKKYCSDGSSSALYGAINDLEYYEFLINNYDSEKNIKDISFFIEAAIAFDDAEALAMALEIKNKYFDENTEIEDL